MRFGPFALDRRTWTLTRDGVPLDLSPRLVEILAFVIDRDGAVATREELLERFWPDVYVSENTLTRAVADIRKALGDPADRPTVIQTLARRGYRFVGIIAREQPGALPAAAVSSDEGDDPFKLWVAGRLALESLDASRLDAACEAMTRAVSAMPGYAPAHAGAANAAVMAFERTRATNNPEVAHLRRAIEAARQAVTLDPQLGEAWAVLGHAQALAGQTDEAHASLRRAIALDPDSWRHQFRLALASWGEARVRAADRALVLLPSCAAAHLLAGMVFVARGAWDRAATVASDGARLQDAQVPGAVLPAAGLHWLRGLVCTAQARLDDAEAELTCEIEQAGRGIYAAESAWLAQSARGFLCLDVGNPDRAAEAFRAAEALNPGAGRSVLGLHLAGFRTRADLDATLGELRRGPKSMDAALVHAAAQAWRGHAGEALDVLQRLLRDAPPGPPGWNIAADPMFLPLHRHAGMPDLRAAVAARAA
jgi:DNA-binding winged helix-turn-helix (wHTH) protein/cytochrome c-type biogenesis protein CcmH/NrfG